MSEAKCFHCNLPIVGKQPPLLEVGAQQQVFCCHGCKAVCEMIVSSGHGDYYKHREGSAKTFNSNELPELLDKLKLYDNEEIQREFVRTDKSNDWKEAWLILEEIRCVACMWLNEKTLRQLGGVLDVQMDYAGQQVRVRWNPKSIKLSDILQAITQIGYHAHPFDPTQRESLDKEQKQRSIHRIIFAAILGMAVMQSAIGGYFFGDINSQGEYPLWFSISRWVNVASTFLILAYSGQLFFRSAWRDIKNKSLGMDVPVVIGLSVAWVGSLYSTIRGIGDVYFESIAMFVLFLLIARHVELKSRIASTALLDRSAKIIPQTAKRIKEDNAGVLQKIPVIELVKGDKIQISPGEALPVDGLLISTRSSFDESLLTGESLPVVRTAGEQVLGGSINVEQLIEVEVLSTKADSTLSEIHQLAKNSTAFRPYYVDIAEKVAGKFVAIILFIAAVTFLFWYRKSGFNDISNALSHTISVLIVTCPCALALAAPVALSLGASGLSRRHVLAVRMSSIEKLAHVDTIVFDKTGTLTAGSPNVESIKSLGEEGKEHYLWIAASLEHGSHHPFAKAIQKYHHCTKQPKGGEVCFPSAPLSINCKSAQQSCSNKLISPKNLKLHSGQGIEGEINKEKWRIGNKSFVSALIDNREELSTTLRKEIMQWREQGSSVIYLGNRESLQAIFFIVAPLREGISSFLRQIDNYGIKRKVILSGDHQKSVTAIAKQLDTLDITEAKGGLSPHEKLAWIKKEQQSGQTVMMLGDGINDAPVLAMADISLAFSDATDLAKNNSDLLILEKSYSTLGDAFQLMRRTRRTILQNLGWAIAYNVLAIPAAVIGLVTPWMAAIGMSVSSLLVVLNSLRLKKQ